MPSRIVIVGAGVAGLEALAVVRSHEDAPDAEVMVVAPDKAFTLRALGVGEPFGLGRPHRYGLEQLLPRLGGRHVEASVSRVRPENACVQLDDGRPLAYDALLVAVGAESVPAYEHGISFDRAATPEAFDEALRDLSDGIARSVAIVVPPERDWALPAYELALLLSGFTGAATEVTIVSGEPRPLDVFGAAASTAVADVLSARSVTWRHGTATDVVTDTDMLVDGQWLHADRVVHLPLPAGPRIAGLPSDRRGFVTVDEACRVPVAGRVWGAGDGTCAGRGSGAIAAQLACRAADEIVRALDGRVTTPRPPLGHRGLLRTPDGPLYLRADVDDPDGTSTWSRSPLWWPASKVAAPYLTSALLVSDGPLARRRQPPSPASPSRSTRPLANA